MHNVPALYAYAIPASSHSHLKERFYLQFTNEETQYFQGAFYSETIQVIDLENCHQWRIIPGEGNSGGQRRKEPKPGDVVQAIRPISQKMTLQLKQLKLKIILVYDLYLFF